MKQFSYRQEVTGQEWGCVPKLGVLGSGQLGGVVSYNGEFLPASLLTLLHESKAMSCLFLCLCPSFDSRVRIVLYQRRSYQRKAYCLVFTNQRDQAAYVFFRRHLTTLASLEITHRKAWRASAIGISCNNCLFTDPDPFMCQECEDEGRKLDFIVLHPDSFPQVMGKSIG